MKRRDLFLYGGRAALSGLAARVITQDVVFAQQESQVSPDALEQRIAGAMEAYGAQGRGARRSQHNAVVVLTRGIRPGLYLLNASNFRKPVGPPMLQISSSESGWLRELAAERAEATLVAQVKRTAVRASNVTAKI